ncbi:cupin domain-containing protein [Candidatus Micrarchaeota archaeon]|nr:cupin domain-containing protein [Candidatus Micrarchaeota archaeon]
MKNKIELQECPEFIARDKTVLREILNPDKGGFPIGYSLAWFKVLPKQRSKKHSLESSEVYFIISGKGKMHIGKEEFEVKGNDTVFIPPNTIQYIENLSNDEEIVAICIVEPFWKKEDEKIYE